MTPSGEFSLHPLLPALKTRITAIHHHDDRLYLGTSTGHIRVYSWELDTGETKPTVKHIKAYPVSRKAIDQIGVLPNERKIVVISDSTVTLYSLDELRQIKVLTLARYAHCFAIASNATGTGDVLFVGCRKKIVVFGAGRGGFKEAWDLSLPHSPRHVVLSSSLSPRTAHLLYSTTSSTLLSIDPESSTHLSVTDITLTGPQYSQEKSASSSAEGSGGPSTSGSGLSKGMGVSALSGLGGYVGLGGKAANPVGTRTVKGEACIAREDNGIFLSSEGSSTRSSSLTWSAPPESLAYSNPFIYSIVPFVPPTASSSASSSVSPPTSAIQVHLSPTLHLYTTLILPLPSAGGLTAQHLCPIRSSSNSTLASSVSSSIKFLFISTPLDKTLATSEGSSIWSIESGDLGECVDSLVQEGRVADAIGLVEAVGESGFAPSRRLPHLKTLMAVQRFAQGQYQTAMETFVTYNVNPALVISLFPAETISGRLHNNREAWMSLFGAVDGALLEPRFETQPQETSKGLLSRVAHVHKKSSVETLKSKNGDKDLSSTVNDVVLPRAAYEALVYFLTDRRQKLNAPMATTEVPSESSLAPLSSLAAETLYALPSTPFSDLNPETLLRMAQVVYTALIKVYLVARPILVGSLCRIENWCDVEEVEGLLKDQKKFSDLVDLYQGKKMHKKALAMLHDLAMEEEDKLDRYPPTIEYLQKLGPSELPLILETSKWIFKGDPGMALKIFTADKAGVEALPRMEVMRFLDETDETCCSKYLEHIIDDLGETRSEFHDRLAELYLARVDEQSMSDIEMTKPLMTDGLARLLDFLARSHSYRPYRISQKLTRDIPEVQAVLLGRQGRHEEALKIYLYRLKDYSAAESYCAQVYAKDPDPKGIFLLLLTLYLRPSSSDPVLLEPALSLIGTHGTRLDAEQVLGLLPPLVTMKQVEAFMFKTLRDGFARKNNGQIVKELLMARRDQMDRILLDLQVHRVRITDQRLCPQCHKRLGQSAIAVHAPRGEVTHLHCKDSFALTLSKMRGGMR
ncbi:hypothetical protein BD324DRAFT_642956 [Kockovaella imperatae]|uniref:CNH domain-containing protein n=1 Tax=Kockovaella imperatae TaxID=4999 RepID=A0A1Y1UB30_9TREE|nr:hypothetical protein BD324DRAFT_642956 [Kockovaella imperatae]ORX35229.1 hypothetical protein BD324DRAFT_642956 [Kockovaella imperatae]